VVGVQVRPGRRQRGRCGVCRRPCRGHDRGDSRRRRHLDAGGLPFYLEADAPRVACPQHGPTQVAVPWARHKAGHTRAFDDTVAWPAVATAKTTLCQLLRIAWRTVGSIVTRVAADAVAARDPLTGLRRIGIDEIGYKRGHCCLTVVVDHDGERLVWAAPGRDKATLRRFFDALGADRSAQVTHVSADGADWIGQVVAERCPTTVLCADPYHLVSWITDALDDVRRQVWNDARRTGDTQGNGQSSAAPHFTDPAMSDPAVRWTESLFDRGHWVMGEVHGGCPWRSVTARSVTNPRPGMWSQMSEVPRPATLSGGPVAWQSTVTTSPS
jgi:transposase